MLRKGVYLYWIYGRLQKSQWKPLPEKEDFYSHLNMEDITGADYAHTKRVCKDFKIKNLGEYHDLFVQRDTLLLADVFSNFRNTYLKKIKVKLDLWTDIGMLLLVEKGIRGGTYHAIHWYVKANTKYMKDYERNKE